MDDYLKGQRYPLSLIHTDPGVVSTGAPAVGEPE
jgi:hypothetical protein